MKVMAGFSQDESYFVLRTSVDLPLPIEQLCHLLVPKLTEWRAQAASPQGDKSTCCTHFLHDIVPFLVEILVQDEIFLIRDFPDHQMSLYLKVKYTRVSLFLLYALP